MDALTAFSDDVKRWGLLDASKIFVDRFINFAELETRPYLKPIQSALARIFFAVKIRKAAPVFIYQMGKVGSLSIYYNLLRYFPGVVVHSHDFKEDHPHYQTRRLYRWAAVGKKPINIISLVREPISRNISAIFQSYERDLGIPFDGENISYEKLKEVLLKRYKVRQTYWFEKHIEPNFGIDVYAAPFPASGYATYSKDNARLLVMRSELPNSEKENIVRDFLGLKEYRIVDVNVSAEKGYADQYRKFKNLVKLPKEYVDGICDSKFARHFYPVDVIENARAAWSQSSS